VPQYQIQIGGVLNLVYSKNAYIRMHGNGLLLLLLLLLCLLCLLPLSLGHPYQARQ